MLKSFKPAEISARLSFCPAVRLSPRRVMSAAGALLNLTPLPGRVLARGRRRVFFGDEGRRGNGTEAWVSRRAANVRPKTPGSEKTTGGRTTAKMVTWCRTSGRIAQSPDQFDAAARKDARVMLHPGCLVPHEDTSTTRNGNQPKPKARAKYRDG